MSSVLLTFLGRVPKDQQSYRVTRYDFGDGQTQELAAFFGWPLQQRLHAERLVIMGTTGSRWDHLFEGDLSFGNAGDEARLALVEACEEMAVTTALLAPLAPLLVQRLGCEVRLEIIPYAHDPAEQVALLRIMAAHVEAGDRVHLDVTHGFRHLPMLGILSALHLRIARQAKIDALEAKAGNLEDSLPDLTMDPASSSAPRAVPPVAGSVAVINSDGTASPPADAPQAVKDVIAAGNAIIDLPYVWGGGHGSFESSGYDCSGSVSYALHGGGLISSPLDSTGLTTWGEPGEGNWITVYGNSGHAFMHVAGISLDTSGTGGSGPSWSSDLGWEDTSAFVARHPSGL